MFKIQWTFKLDFFVKFAYHGKDLRITTGIQRDFTMIQIIQISYLNGD